MDRLRDDGGVRRIEDRGVLPFLGVGVRTVSVAANKRAAAARLPPPAQTTASSTFFSRRNALRASRATAMAARVFASSRTLSCVSVGSHALFE